MQQNGSLGAALTSRRTHVCGAWMGWLCPGHLRVPPGRGGEAEHDLSPRRLKTNMHRQILVKADTSQEIASLLSPLLSSPLLDPTGCFTELKFGVPR